MPDVIIMGGGLSGLSAAVELAAAGAQPLVLEQRNHCGGRAYSFIDHYTQKPIDNGQHLLLGCYKSTRKYIKKIGTESTFDLQPALHIPYFEPCKTPLAFSSLPFPAPFHLLSGLMRFEAVPFLERWTMIKFAASIFLTSKRNEEELNRLTADEWLNKHHQSEASRKYLWDVITIGALNHTPDHVSALMLYRVLRTTFSMKRENSSFLIPKKDLTSCLIQPAINYIERHGGTVQTEKEVSQVMTHSDRIVGLRTKDGKEFCADKYICALPWYAAKKLFIQSDVQEAFHDDLFHSSPIIGIHLWFDRCIMREPFAAAIGTRLQWVFNKSFYDTQNADEKQSCTQHLSCVISGAHEYISWTKDKLIQTALKDIAHLIPQSQSAKVVHAVVIKEKQATFIPVPGLEMYRPKAKTKIQNLFLAGDWTDTGFPATIEGAIMSGQRAANLAL